MADLVRVELTREEAEQIDQLGSGRIFVIASQREAAERVRAKARAALDTPQPESGGVEEAACSAIEAIDALVEWMAVSGLAEEGGGLALYEKTKPLAEARAELASALAADRGRVRCEGWLPVELECCAKCKATDSYDCTCAENDPQAKRVTVRYAPQPPQAGLSVEERERLERIAEELEATEDRELPVTPLADAAFLRSLADQKGEGS